MAKQIDCGGFVLSVKIASSIKYEYISNEMDAIHERSEIRKKLDEFSELPRIAELEEQLQKELLYHLGITEQDIERNRLALDTARKEAREAEAKGRAVRNTRRRR